MTSNEQIIRDFISAWSRLDVETLLGYFADDAIYHNMPIAPVSGAQIRPFITAFLKGWTETNWEVLTLVSSGNIVIAERIDRTKLGDKSVDLPCCGVFEMQDGKIKIWRDYFDMMAYTRAIAG
jgi:limonene-1,2-epoxide hydrolase